MTESTALMDPRLSTIIGAHAGHCPRGRKNAIRFLALALAGEAGELANDVKKEWRGDDQRARGGWTTAELEQIREEKIKGELVDVVSYGFMLAKKLNLDLPPAMLRKFREVEQRPEYKNYGKAKRR